MYKKGDVGMGGDREIEEKERYVFARLFLREDN